MATFSLGRENWGGLGVEVKDGLGSSITITGVVVVKGSGVPVTEIVVGVAVGVGGLTVIVGERVGCVQAASRIVTMVKRRIRIINILSHQQGSCQTRSFWNNQTVLKCVRKLSPRVIARLPKEFFRQSRADLQLVDLSVFRF
jgi:hypothetical protein